MSYNILKLKLQTLPLWLKRDVPALPLDIFRVLVGILAFAYFLCILREVPDFSAPDGLLDHELLHRIFWYIRLSLFQPGMPAWSFYSVFALACVGALGIIIGYRVKLCAGVLFAIAVSTYRWNFIVMNVDDALMHFSLFWLLLLPVGQTLVWRDWRQEGAACFNRWCGLTVPGTAVRCLLVNVCLVYLIAGLWKLESPFWRDGFALYAILRLPVAYMPDLWQPHHLPILRAMSYLALIVELLLPVLLTSSRGHWLKWIGLCGQVGFHLGIIITLKVPFANLALMATAVLFLRDEIMQRVLRHRPETPTRSYRPRFHRLTSRLAIVVVVVIPFAMTSGLPILGALCTPARAVLWAMGVAQEYKLFDWVDRKNYRVEYDVNIMQTNGQAYKLPSDDLFPSSPHGLLVQTYLYDVYWSPLPDGTRPLVKKSIMTRAAKRFCRRRPMTATASVWANVQRVESANIDLTHSEKRFIMRFRCQQTGTHLTATMMD
ncbi:MAG: hypothetical protein ETSY2_19700 [Candidatus Entotheonella gemina]|uniref:HTTM-like domain-containing protein n=1 Tax=Candidatus Entotheonella gemina TaxID=1429439 RepID=W4M719_9BACT|nr:MAG: hypothetical protein ETSY2_19700 [Candidatus Entotheonella gemina]